MQCKIANDRVVFLDEKVLKQQEKQSNIQEMVSKRVHGKLTLEDIFDQGQIIIELLQKVAK
jgi:hypothetical protein